MGAYFSRELLHGRAQVPTSSETAASFITILDENLLLEILLRIPNTSTLIRASATCKRWLRLIRDPSFLRRFRLLHPPLLVGHFFDEYRYGFTSHTCCFVPVSPSPDPPASRAVQSSLRTIRRILGPHGRLTDCCRGRLLLQVDRGLHKMAVYNPLSGDRFDIPSPDQYEEDFSGLAMDIDEDDAAGSSFRVSVIWHDLSGAGDDVGIFSSDTRCWRVFPSVLTGMVASHIGLVRVGGILYGQLGGGKLVALDLRTQQLSHVELPGMSWSYNYERIEMMGSEEHLLRFVAVRQALLHVWLYREDSHGWSLEKEVDLRAAFGWIVGEELTFEQFICEYFCSSASAGFAFFSASGNGSWVFSLHLETARMERSKYGCGLVFPYSTPWPPSFPILDDDYSDAMVLLFSYIIHFQ